MTRGSARGRVYRVVLVDVKIRERTVAPYEELARLRIPNADRAVIEPTKLHDYLLSRGHPVDRFKASFFLALGSPLQRLVADALGLGRLLAEALHFVGFVFLVVAGKETRP